MTVFEKHNKAMDLAEQAFKLVQQSPDASQKLFEEAYYIEKAIADTIERIEENEPSRSIFYRSAASLALNAKLFREAEICTCLGKSGVGDNVDLDELRDIFA